MNEKTLLQTKGRDREMAPVSGGKNKFLSLHELEAGRLNLDDLAYLTKFSEPKERAKWRKEVEVRRSEIPAYSFWKCGKCGWKTRGAGDAGGGICIRCNLQNFVGGGHLEKMSAKEGVEFERVEGERFKAEVEQLGRMEFNRRNADRAEEGRPPMTRAEFDEQRRAAWELECQRQAQLSKAKP